MESVVTRGQADSGTWLRGLNSVVLKNETVDPSRARVSARHGGCDVAGLGGAGGIGSQVWPAACDGSGLCFRSAIHLQGPPLTESPGWCQVHERGDTRRSPQGQARPRALPITLDRQVLERMAATGAGIGCPHGIGSACDALQGAPGDERRRSHKQGSANKGPTGRDLKGHGQPDSRIGPSEAGNDCDAFRSAKELAIRSGHREPSVDACAPAASRRSSDKRR